MLRTLTRRFAAPLLAVTLALPAPLWAACAGSDLRSTLTPAEQTALQTRLKDAPYPVGNHWRARKGDEVIHLIGTVHLDDPRLDAPTGRLAPVIETAGRLLLELTATEEAELKTAIGTRPDLLVLQGTSLPELMPEEDWQKLSEAMTSRGLPPFMAAKFQPWYVSMLLSLPPCMMATMGERQGLDSRLEAIATDAGVPTGALEPFDTGFRAFTDMSMDQQINMIRAALAAPEATEDLMATLLAAYFEQSHLESWQVTEILSPRLSPLSAQENAQIFDAMAQSLLVQRNHAWIPVLLEAAEQTDGTLVAAFGAAHLGGEDGVLNLLAAQGFTLERMPF